MALNASSLVPIPVRAGHLPMSAGLIAPGGAPVLAYVQQSEDNWCWAACGEMLLGLPGHAAMSQCALASSQFSLPCCPSPGAPYGCDNGAWPDVAYPKHGLNTTAYNGPLTSAQVQQELAAGKPVQVCYQWAGGTTTHVALIVDVHGNGDFEVFDPSSTFGQGPRDYSQILSAYGLGSWIITFTF